MSPLHLRNSSAVQFRNSKTIKFEIQRFSKILKVTPRSSLKNQRNSTGFRVESFGNSSDSIQTEIQGKGSLHRTFAGNVCDLCDFPPTITRVFLQTAEYSAMAPYKNSKTSLLPLNSPWNFPFSGLRGFQTLFFKKKLY